MRLHNFRAMPSAILNMKIQKLFFIVAILAVSSHANSACDQYTATNENPQQEITSTLNSSYAPGTYYFYGQTTNAYVKVRKERFDGVSPPNEIEPGMSLNTCVYNPFPIRDCEYISGQLTMTCPAGYTLSNGQCQLTDIQACEASQPPVICDDGLPENLNGYPGCDRPDLVACEDGTYVNQSNGICPVDNLFECWDYDSCYSLAYSESGCAAGSYFEFNYINPEQWETVCTEPPADSPDNISQGGNADGNPYNDPNTPASGQGSSPTVSDADPQTLALAIDEQLKNDFGNVERAIRDGIASEVDNTTNITEKLGSLESTNSDGFASLGDKLDGISGQLSQSGPCDPKQPDYLDCIAPEATALPVLPQAIASDTGEVLANYKSRIDSAPLTLAFANVSQLISAEAGDCPSFSIDLPAPISETITTTLHCDLMGVIAPIISAVMLIIYTFIGFRIFASA